MKETEKILNAHAQKVISLAQINLGATRTKHRVRAKWKKLGPNAWQPISVQRIPFKGRISNSGNLAKSLGYDLKVKPGEILLTYFSTSPYAVFVNDGRKPGKYVPLDNLDEWMRSKPIRSRDSSGRFGGSPSSTRFLINRKIKHFGIEPTYFFDEAYDKISDQLPKSIENALTEDFLNLIKD